MKKMLSMMLVVALLSLFFVGCSMNPPGASGEATQEASAAASGEQSAANSDAGAKDGAYKVGVTLQSLENSYWAGVFSEVETLMKDKGWEYTILSCKDNSATQIEQIENFITNKVDLIMVHPSDPNALEDYLKKARDEGIKVMCWDDKMTNTDLNWVLDNQELGYTIGKAAAQFINENYSEAEQAKVAIMNYPQTPILLDRENGILQALEENAKGKYEVIARQPALDAQTAISNMETIFQATPDTTIVCSIGAGGDIGANEAFMSKFNSEIPKNVGIFSADATQQQMEAIQNNEATRASVGFEGSNKRTAKAVVGLYESLLKGEPVAEQNLFRPLLVIDAQNVDEYLADYK